MNLSEHIAKEPLSLTR